MKGDEIVYNEMYLYVSLGISIGSSFQANRFAVCKFLLIPLLIDPDRIVLFGCKRFKREESIREAE